MVEYVMGWVELHINTTGKQAKKIGKQLSVQGALSITLQNAGDSPNPPWPETLLTALYDDQTDLQPSIAYLSAEQASGRLAHFTAVPLPDEDWERRCLDRFEPIQFGKRLWICPSWQSPPDPNAVNVILDPGLAFGTGTHATTALCLEWLANHIQGGETVIDYGCGSGILAIAALKLGAKQAAAIDLDPNALTATRANADYNQLPLTQLQTYTPEDFNPVEKVDLVLANILADPLIKLAPLLSSYIKPMGYIVLSGILNTQAEKVRNIFNQWFYMQPIVFKEEWAQITGSRL